MNEINQIKQNINELDKDTIRHTNDIKVLLLNIQKTYIESEVLKSHLSDTRKIHQNLEVEEKEYEKKVNEGMIGYREIDNKPDPEIIDKEQSWYGYGKGLPQRSSKRSVDTIRPLIYPNYTCERYIESVDNANSIAGNPLTSSFNKKSFNLSKSTPNV